MKMGNLPQIITRIRAKYAVRSGYTPQSERNANAKPIGINRPRLKRIKSKKGYRSDLDLVVRSKMEANVLRFYEFLKLKHGKITAIEYEPEIFFFKDNPYGLRGYIPDIKITTRNRTFYVEVKGVVDDEAVEKKRLFERDYAGLTLQFITPKEYQKIYRNYGDLIAYWE